MRVAAIYDIHGNLPTLEAVRILGHDVGTIQEAGWRGGESATRMS